MIFVCGSPYAQTLKRIIDKEHCWTINCTLGRLILTTLLLHGKYNKSKSNGNQDELLRTWHYQHSLPQRLPNRARRCRLTHERVPIYRCPQENATISIHLDWSCPKITKVERLVNLNILTFLDAFTGITLCRLKIFSMSYFHYSWWCDMPMNYEKRHIGAGHIKTPEIFV